MIFRPSHYFTQIWYKQKYRENCLKIEILQQILGEIQVLLFTYYSSLTSDQ